MNHIVLPDSPSRGLAFYLAAEEFAAMDRNAGEAFFVWSVKPTVIFGRNQDIFTEVNMDYCREHGVDIVRRKSGGGCVYADTGNIMISYITKRGDVQDVFGRYLDMMVKALEGLGVRAERSGRNDIIVDGAKVSGNAFRMLPDRCVVHGTLLYDVDFGAMSQAISPSSGKLASKGVSSVRSRVTNLKGYLEQTGHGDMDAPALKAYLTDFFCDSFYEVTVSQVLEIENIEKTYKAPAFLYGRGFGDSCCSVLTPDMVSGTSFSCSGNVPGVGEVTVSLSLDNDGMVADMRLSGDYFLLDGMTPETIDRTFTGALKGCVPTSENLNERIEALNPDSMIMNLTAGRFAKYVIPHLMRDLIMKRR